MRGSHGSSRDRFGSPVIPSGSDVQAWAEDINGGTIIGERGSAISDGGSGDGDRFPHAGGRAVAAVPVIISGGYDDSNTAMVKLNMGSHVSGVILASHPLGTYRPNSLVDTVRGTATQAHRSNGGFAGRRCLLGDPVEAGDAAVRWRGSVTVDDKKEGKKVYMSELKPRPLSPRTFTAMTLEALATP